MVGATHIGNHGGQGGGTPSRPRRRHRVRDGRRKKPEGRPRRLADLNAVQGLRERFACHKASFSLARQRSRTYAITSDPGDAEASRQSRALKAAGGVKLSAEITEVDHLNDIPKESVRAFDFEQKRGPHRAAVTENKKLFAAE